MHNSTSDGLLSPPQYTAAGYRAGPSSPPLRFPLAYLCFGALVFSLPPLHRAKSTKKDLSTCCQRRLRGGKCKAEFSTDSPVAMAIGACILNSLIFPVAPSPEDAEAESLIDSAEAKFAVMGIISFLPYFNWLSWVFAWLDTENRRYAVYALVYLAPYLRPNLSISPEESWLPIGSILLCIAHIQLEASIKNGDIQGFQLFNEAAKRV